MLSRLRYIAVVESQEDLYNELTYYTLAHGDPSFIHQHVVDAYAAQTAGARTKPIALFFALIGLYLYIEKGFTGRQVQRAHMALAGRRKPWPRFTPPAERGRLSVADVVATPPGSERDVRIHEWCAEVWSAWKTWNGTRDQVIEHLEAALPNLGSRN